MISKTTYGSLIAEIEGARRGTFETAAMAAIIQDEGAERAPLAGRMDFAPSAAQLELVKIGYECDDLARALRRAALDGAERLSIFAERIGGERSADYLPDDPTRSSAVERVSEIRASLHALRRTFSIVARLALGPLALATLGATLRSAPALSEAK